MAAQDPPLDEMQWRSPDTAAMMQGIHSNSVLFYFSSSPYFDRTSNNAVLYQQALTNAGMLHFIQTREAFEGRLKTMGGLEFIVAQEPADAVNGTGVWVIRKQTRRKKAGQEDEVTVHSTYFVVGENVYMAPAVSDVLASRTLSIISSLNKFYSKAQTLPNFTPATGTTYIPPSTSRTTTSQPTLGQASKENTPLPNSNSEFQSQSQNTKKSASSHNSTYLLNETIRTTMAYENDYMDENPITGEPGAFHFSNSGRIEKEKGKLAVPEVGKPVSSAGNSKVGTPAALVVKTDVEPMKAKKGEKTPTKSPGSAKLKRKRSKIGPISPTT